MDQSSAAMGVVVPREYDSFANAPEYKPLRTAVATFEWAPTEAVLAELPSELASQWMSALSERPRIELFLRKAVADHPESCFARTALANRLITLGWEWRTSARASDVSRENFAEFHARLREAEQLLIGVCADQPDFAPAWSLRVITARGLELGKSEAYRRYRRFEQLDAHDLSTQAHMLQYLLPKWFGTAEEAAAFVGESIKTAPEGSPSAALAALYHLEMWLAAGQGRGSYLRVPQVIAELRTTSERLLAGPAVPLDPVLVYAHSSFAMAFWLTDQKQDALRHITATGGRASRFPWLYSLDNVHGLDSIYREVGAVPERQVTE